MKRIIAFVKPHMLDDVIFALHEVKDFPGASISEVKGIGSGKRDDLTNADRKPFDEFPKSIRMEIVCPDDQAAEIIRSIESNAHTGLPGDGKIYVSEVEEAVRIRTGERGEPAA